MLRDHSALPRLTAQAPSLRSFGRSGAVSAVVGLTAEVEGLTSYIGEHVLISRQPAAGSRQNSTTALCPLPAAGCLAQVVGFRANRTIVMPFSPAAGIAAGSRVVALGRSGRITVGPGLLGRVVDGLGVPI